MTSLLFTGSEGFIGRNLLPLLAADYSRIDTLGRSEACTVHADLSKDVPALPTRYDVVIHVAGLAHVPSTEAEMDAVNNRGTQRLCRALEDAGVPRTFIYMSTVAVYGADEGFDIDVNAAPQPKTPYGISKYAAEQFLRRWADENGVHLYILRLPLVLGPNAPGNLGAMTRAIARGRYLSIGRGDTLKSLVTIDAIADVLKKLPAEPGTYNLVSHNMTVRALEGAIANHYGRRLPAAIPHAVVMGAAYVAAALLGARSPLTPARVRKLTRSLTFKNSIPTITTTVITEWPQLRK